MIQNKFFIKHLILSFIFILAFLSCMEQNGTGLKGVLKGKISIGPLCPVETVPPNPACSPTTETYKTWETAVWNLNKKTKVTTLHPTLDGNYQTELPSGDYTIDFNATQNYRAGSNLPSVITIVSGDTTVFNIHIDTGIR